MNNTNIWFILSISIFLWIISIVIFVYKYRQAIKKDKATFEKWNEQDKKFAENEEKRKKNKKFKMSLVTHFSAGVTIVKLCVPLQWKIK